jgi:hypothetical protein
VTFQYNIVRRIGGGLNLAAHPESYPAVPAARFRFLHNIFEQVGDPSVQASGPLWQFDGAADIEFAHNTGYSPRFALYLSGAPSRGRLVLRDNVFGSDGDAIRSADGQGVGVTALNFYYPNGQWAMSGNVTLGTQPWFVYPTGNLYPTSFGAGGLTNDLRVTGAPALGFPTTDGGTPGADRAMVDQKTAGVVMR